MLLCGADMVESLAIPGVWKPEHVRSILRDYGVVCISRYGPALLDMQRWHYRALQTNALCSVAWELYQTAG